MTNPSTHCQGHLDDLFICHCGKTQKVGNYETRVLPTETKTNGRVMIVYTPYCSIECLEEQCEVLKKGTGPLMHVKNAGDPPQSVIEV